MNIYRRFTDVTFDGRPGLGSLEVCLLKNCWESTGASLISFTERIFRD
jgi:hypothetical protein